MTKQKRWEDIDEAQHILEGCHENNQKCYLMSLIYDYSSFVEKYHTPISLNDFVSKYWNIIVPNAFDKLQIGDIIYSPMFDGVMLKVTDYSFYDDDKGDMIEVLDEANNNTTYYVIAGDVYSKNNYYESFIESKERMEKLCQTLPTVLITETNLPQN